MDKRVASHLFFALVPEELLGEDNLFFLVEDGYMPIEAPQLVALEIGGRVAFHRGYHSEAVVELFEQQSARKFPVGTSGALENIPDWRCDAIFRYAGVANERFDIAREHRGCRFGVDFLLHDILHLFLAAHSHKDGNEHKQNITRFVHYLE